MRRLIFEPARSNGVEKGLKVALIRRLDAAFLPFEFWLRCARAQAVNRVWADLDSLEDLRLQFTRISDSMRFAA